VPNPVDLTEEPVATQGGKGTSPGYSAMELRRLAAASQVKEGVVDTGDLKVTLVSGLTVQVAAGEAFVAGDSTADQGLYYARIGSNISTLSVTAGDGSNPRVDQVVLEVLDHAHDSSGFNKARVRVIAGTPTSGATLDNRSGAASLPVNCCRLADILMPTSAGSVSAGNIRDRRPWARGAYHQIIRTADAGGTDDYTYTGSTALQLIDATNMQHRIETSGRAIRMRLRGRAAALTAGNIVYFTPFVDGAVIPGFTAALFAAITETNGLDPSYVDLSWDWTPTTPAVSGSYTATGGHVFGWAWAPSSSAVSANLVARATMGVQSSVEELHAFSASND
jgi:hypothetical protein